MKMNHLRLIPLLLIAIVIGETFRNACGQTPSEIKNNREESGVACRDVNTKWYVDGLINVLREELSGGSHIKQAIEIQNAPLKPGEFYNTGLHKKLFELAGKNPDVIRVAIDQLEAGNYLTVSYDSIGSKNNTYCSLLIKIDNNQYIATSGAKFGYGVPIHPVERFYSSLGDTPPCSRIFLIGSDIGIDTFSIFRSEQKETPPEYEQLAAVLKFYNELNPNENQIKLGTKFISASGKQAFGSVKWGMSHEALIVSSELTQPIDNDDEIMESIVHPPLVAHSHLYCGNLANFGAMWRRLTSNSLYYNIIWPRFRQVNSDSIELKNIMGTAWTCEAFGYGRSDGLGLKSQISIFSSYGMNLEFSDVFQGAGINPPPPYAVVNYKEPLAINNSEYLLNAKALTIEQHEIGAVAVELDVLQDRSIEKSVAVTIRDGLLAKYGPPARVYRANRPDFYDGCHFLNGFMCEWDADAKTVAMVGSTFSTWPEPLNNNPLFDLSNKSKRHAKRLLGVGSAGRLWWMS